MLASNRPSGGTFLCWPPCRHKTSEYWHLTSMCLCAPHRLTTSPNPHGRYGVRATMYRHTKSGASVLSVVAADENKVRARGLATPQHKAKQRESRIYPKEPHLTLRIGKNHRTFLLTRAFGRCCCAAASVYYSSTDSRYLGSPSARRPRTQQACRTCWSTRCCAAPANTRPRNLSWSF